MDNYPPGAASDPNAPYNKPLPVNVRAEVGVELGLFIDFEVIDEDDIKDEIKKVIYDRFKSKDIEVNNIRVYQYDISSKQK